MTRDQKIPTRKQEVHTIQLVSEKENATEKIRRVSVPQKQKSAKMSPLIFME